MEQSASRRLLQRINGFRDEVSVVNDVLEQQISVLTELRGLLDPGTFTTPSIARKLRFNYERKAIDAILASVEENKRSCAELRERSRQLAIQNVQLVETLQDSHSKAIFLFTMVTVLFLPLTFVAGYFGMNLSGISGSNSTPAHFWAIGAPLTFGSVVLCSAVALKGEEILTALGAMVRAITSLGEHKQE